MADDGSAIRRRRECLACGRRTTTFERAEEAPLVVVKRSGERVAFDRDRIVAGVAAAAKNRPVSHQAMASLALEVEEEVRMAGPVVSAQALGIAVLERLRNVDDIAYVRFASVYEGFDDLTDFERAVGELTKATEPKRTTPPLP